MRIHAYSMSSQYTIVKWNSVFKLKFETHFYCLSLFLFFYMEYLELVILGTLAGFLGALLGIGGGVLLVPSLVFFFHVPIHQAVAVSLIAIIATSTQVASFGIQHGFANVRLGLFLEIASMAGAILSSFVAVRIESHWIERIFSLTLFITAFLLIRRPKGQKITLEPNDDVGYFGGQYYDPAEKKTIAYRVYNLPWVSSFSFIAGMLSGMVGTSGGIFKVPIMNLLGRIPIRAAAVTSSFMIGFTGLGGAIAYFRAGLVQPALVAPVVLGIVVGSAVGNRVGVRLKNRWLEWLFAVVLIVAAIKMGMK